MRIDFPDHPIGEWELAPWYMFWRKGVARRKHWRWTVDWNGCKCDFYWQYQ